MIRSGPIEGLTADAVAIIGVPWDTHSSFLRGAAAGPLRIREALASRSGNLWTENGLDLGTHPRIADAGDIDLAREDASIEDIERGLGAILSTGAHALVLRRRPRDHLPGAPRAPLRAAPPDRPAHRRPSGPLRRVRG